MRTRLLIIFLCILFFENSLSQNNNGVVAVELPVRNSLVFNKHIINPTFSFVREQNKFISAYNKREWVQFDDAPTSYLLSYSGRFAENIGAGVTLFQQDYGVLSTYGGILNFAYNAQLDRDMNLTFGLNLAAYSSGINQNNVVTNFPDPALANIESNFLVSVNPGINFGTESFDFGVSIPNAILYNVQTSEMLEDVPTQGIQGHLMYTGYMSGRGFFEDSRFTGLVRSEFRNDETIISGNAMLNIPKGFWVQAGYNSKFGASGGLGLNITEEIALEYNFETSIGQFSGFGPSHEITLAYRFKNDRYSDYTSQDEVTSLIKTNKYKRPRSRRVVKRKPVEPKLEDESKKADAIEALKAEEEAKRISEENQAAEALKAKQIAEQKAKEEAERLEKERQDQEEAKRIDEEKKAEEALKAKQLAGQKAKEEAERLEKERLEQEEAKRIAEEKKAAEALKAKQLAEQKAKEEAERLEKERQEQQEAKRIAEEKRASEELKAKQLAEQEAKNEAERIEKIKAEERAKRETFEQNQQELEKARKAIKEARRKEAERQEEERLKLAEQAKIAKQEKELKRISNPVSKTDKALKKLSDATEKSSSKQADLLERFNKAVELKNENLKSLKEENDLSEKGIKVNKPKKFVSVTKQNRELESVRNDLEKSIKDRNDKINELEELYNDINEVDTIVNDVVMLYYKKEINRLKTEQKEASQAKIDLDNRLTTIQTAIEFEKRRRIKRAEYDNDEERYAQDRARLENLKRTTSPSTTPLNSEDFDQGDIVENNIQILQNVKNVIEGVYVVIAVHETEEKRDEFVTSAIAEGLNTIDFFYDVNTSKYYIYSQKMNSIQDANNAVVKNKGTKPYNTKMSVIKIEK